MWLFVIVGAVIALGAFASDTDADAPIKRRETLVEPPDATEATARYVVELEWRGESVYWAAYGAPTPVTDGIIGPRAELGKDRAGSREEAVEAAMELIDRERGKLPEPIRRHGLRLTPDCSRITVQDLGTWIDWASRKIDAAAARARDKDGNVSAGLLMRQVFKRAFPECPDATPKVRDRSWAKIARQTQGIIDKEIAGDFIDVHPLSVVLAARLVGMSPPKVPGTAFFYASPKDLPFAVVVTKTAPGKWRWRIWKDRRSGEKPRAKGRAASLEAAAADAKAEISSYTASVGISEA